MDSWNTLEGSSLRGLSCDSHLRSLPLCVRFEIPQAECAFKLLLHFHLWHPFLNRSITENVGLCAGNWRLLSSSVWRHQLVCNSCEAGHYKYVVWHFSYFHVNTGVSWSRTDCLISILYVLRANMSQQLTSESRHILLLDHVYWLHGERVTETNLLCGCSAKGSPVGQTTSRRFR